MILTSLVEVRRIVYCKNLTDRKSKCDIDHCRATWSGASLRFAEDAMRLAVPYETSRDEDLDEQIQVRFDQVDNS